MEERIARWLALSTSSSAIVESIGLLLKINGDMASADNPTILALTPYDLYGGENHKVVSTLHNIVDF
jgi:hypothetical protein